MIAPEITGLVSACTALVASVVGPVITLRIGRAQINATVVSANRQKWIDGLRDLIASFCSQLATVAQIQEKLMAEGRPDLLANPDLLQRFERLVLTITKIHLLINPTEADHQALVGLMDGILAKLRAETPLHDADTEAEAAIRAIVATTQVILKREWMRVKRGL